MAAFATLSFGVLIPLFLRSGVDAFNAGTLRVSLSACICVCAVLRGYVYVSTYSTHTRPNPPDPCSSNPPHPTLTSIGGAVGAEKKASAAGKPVPTKAGAKSPASKPAVKPAAAKAGKAVAMKGNAKAAAAAPAPKKKGWF